MKNLPEKIDFLDSESLFWALRYAQNNYFGHDPTDDDDYGHIEMYQMLSLISEMKSKGESIPEYILKDQSEFVPEEWGWKHHDELYVDEEKFSIRDEDNHLTIWEHGHTKECRIIRRDQTDWYYSDVVIYSGPLTPTLYRLIAEANGIPLPENKKL